MKLIGLCGYAGAGKDHVYELLRDFYGNNRVARVALADGVRNEIEEELGVEIPALWNKPYSEPVRKLLQWWGTDYRRADDPDYWVKRAMAVIDLLHNVNPSRIIVVTDVRFLNEAAMIQSRGGIVCQVTADEKTRAERLGGTLPPQHASEVIDFEAMSIIRNDWRTVLGVTVTQYLGLPTHCTKCRTLTAKHPWHDDGTYNYEGAA